MATKEPSANSQIIYRTWITVKGRRLYARAFGLKAWPIVIRPK